MENNFYKDFREWAKTYNAISASSFSHSIIEQYNSGFFTMQEALRLLMDTQTREYIKDATGR